uniref:Uncharacterized protein n=1 Tax=Sphaerodactylus townsendi TaxID=933632 RepID=A0ACB8FS18_9SAUR
MVLNGPPIRRPKYGLEVNCYDLGALEGLAAMQRWWPPLAPSLSLKVAVASFLPLLNRQSEVHQAAEPYSVLEPTAATQRRRQMSKERWVLLVTVDIHLFSCVDEQPAMVDLRQRSPTWCQWVPLCPSSVFRKWEVPGRLFPSKASD